MAIREPGDTGAMESEVSWAAAVAITVPVGVVLIGAGFFVRELAVRGADGRLQRNRLAGLRSPATLASDEAWLIAHRAGLVDSVRGGTVAVWCGAISLLVSWLLAMFGVVDAEGVVVTWSVIILIGVAAMSILLLRGFIYGNRAAKALTASGES